MCRQAAPGSVPAGQGGQGTYGKVGFSYGTQDSDRESEESEDEKRSASSLSSEDSEDEKVVSIGRQYGVRNFNRMVAQERKAKEDEKVQKDAARGDPSVVSQLFVLLFGGVRASWSFFPIGFFSTNFLRARSRTIRASIPCPRFRPRPRFVSK